MMKSFFVFDIEKAIDKADSASLHELLRVETQFNTDAGRRAEIYFKPLEILKSTNLLSKYLDELFGRYAYKDYIGYNNINNFCNDIEPTVALARKCHRTGDALKGFYIESTILHFLLAVADSIHPSENEVTDAMKEILDQILECALTVPIALFDSVRSEFLQTATPEAIRQTSENIQLLRIVQLCFSSDAKSVLDNLSNELEVPDDLDKDFTPFIQAEIMLHKRLRNDEKVLELIAQNVSMPLIRLLIRLLFTLLFPLYFWERVLLLVLLLRREHRKLQQ